MQQRIALRALFSCWTGVQIYCRPVERKTHTNPAYSSIVRLGPDVELLVVTYIPGNSEKKLDRMDRRLNDIAEMLEELKNDASTKNHLCKHIVHTPDLAGMPAEILHSCSTGLNNTPPDTQADSTMAAHSEFAHDIIQKAVTSQPFISHKPEMRKFFDELKDTIRSFGPSDFPSEMSYPNATPIQRHSLLGCEMPPIDKVVQVIRNPNCKPQLCNLSCQKRIFVLLRIKQETD